MEAVVVKAEERKALDVYSGNVSVSCAAPPEVVYDILADLRTHVVWGGQTNRMHQRLLTIEAPDEPATVGTTFQSVGYTSHGLWHDRSEVTQATPRSVFEFTTNGTMQSRPPFHGTDLLDTLAQVRWQEPLPPRQLRSGIPRELEAVCLTCLHEAPRRSYASATDLADDLGRFGRNEPVRARPVTGWARWVGWGRRS